MYHASRHFKTKVRPNFVLSTDFIVTKWFLNDKLKGVKAVILSFLRVAGHGRDG